MTTRVNDLVTLIGEPVLLLPWTKGLKGDDSLKWGKYTASKMLEPNYRTKLEQGNIGVALGQKSGNLISIDIDDDDGLTEFVRLNTNIADTLRSRGRRGGNLWYRMLGEYPSLKILKRNGVDWGEWRSDGGQTIISGEHPDGGSYTITNSKRPLEIRFEDIQWPDGVIPPTVSTLQKLTDSRLLRASVCLC